MATKVTKTIGTGKDYSSIQAWEDAAPASLINADQIWHGELYRDGTGTDGEWIISTEGIGFSSPGDADRYYLLDAPAGQSFVDRPNRPLRYNPEHGVAVFNDTSYATRALFHVEENANVKIVGIQVRAAAKAGNGAGASFGAQIHTHLFVSHCIAHHEGRSQLLNATLETTMHFENLLFTCSGTTVIPHDFLSYGFKEVTFKYCTFVVNAATPRDRFMDIKYGGPRPVIQNCAFFGYGTVGNTADQFNAASSHNATGAGSLFSQTGSLEGVAVANQFVDGDPASATADFKLKAGSALIGKGMQIAGVTTDIYRYTRSATPAIGAAEYAEVSLHSKWTFEGATSPVVGDNGNPFGSVTTTLSMDAEGILSSGRYDGFHTAISASAFTEYDKGYTLEIRYKATAEPPSASYIFAMENANTNNWPILINRGGTRLDAYHRDDGAAATSTESPSGLVLHDGLFHTYKIVYDGTNLEWFRDGVSVGAKTAASKPGLSYQPSNIWFVGNPAGYATDVSAPVKVAHTYVRLGLPPQAPTKPDPVTGLQVVNTDQTSTTAMWTASSGATGYHVEIAASPYTSWGSASDVTLTQAYFGGLTPSTTYKVRVSAFNAQGDAAWVESSPFTTAAPAVTPPTVTTTTMPDGTTGVAYSKTLTATGDTPITWTQPSGSLPAGLSLSSAGVISGTPTNAGTATFSVRATNSGGSDDQALSMTVTAAAIAPTITTTSLPDGLAGTAYSQQINATGTAPITYSAASGSLPSGMTLSQSGLLSGTPSVAGVASFTVRATNSVGSDDQGYNLSITAASVKPTITTSTLYKGKVGTAYATALTATGTSPITWTKVSGDIPPGLSLGSDGAISGTPTTDGSFTFVAKASNVAGDAQASFTMTIDAASTGSQPSIDVPYAQRPTTLDGCWSSWSEQQQQNLLRTQMDSGAIKVRRRTTGIARVAQVSVSLPAEKYATFMSWYNVNCQQGVLPTLMCTPQCNEELWRFTEPPQITWTTKEVFVASAIIERLPGW